MTHTTRGRRTTSPNTRELAVKALYEVSQRAGKPKKVLEAIAVGLDQRDRNFLMELVYGVLRYRDTLDWTIKPFLRKPSGLGITTLLNLRVTAYQILFLRVPAWAAVYEAVEIEKSSGKPHVVNGVLRSLLRGLDKTRSELLKLDRATDVKSISISTSYPEWLIKRWSERFGPEGARRLAEANNKVPPLTVRVNTMSATRDEMLRKFSQEGIRAEPTVLSPDGISLGDFRLFSGLPWKDALIVQDEASQLISYLVDPQPGERILDACSAPGGKSTHMAQLMNDIGEVVAVDVDEERLRRLSENVASLALKSVRIVPADITASSFHEEFDRILLDAPCSALGVIRRNPDIKYRHDERDLGDFREKQVRMLRSVAKFLRRGGILVYSVCSTEPEEGEDVVREFLKHSEDFFIMDTTVPFLRKCMNHGFFRTYPHQEGTDGFFGTRLCRRT